ncbi:MAG: NUDIX hydrolase [Crocosphaera sp.]
MENDFFSVKTKPFMNGKWVYADAKKVLLIVFGFTEKTNSLILIRQYRPPVNKFVISAPMGAFPDASLDKIIPIAAKEAEGETGYKILDINYFLTIDRSPGLTNEKAHIFVSKYSEKSGEQNIHEDEIIEVLRIPKHQILNEIIKYTNLGDDIDSSILLLLNLPV